MKKILRIAMTIGLVATIGFMSSCEKQYFVPEPEKDPTIPVDSISYADDMQLFFDNSCVGCHNGSGIPLNLSPGVSYDAIINGGYISSPAASSKLYVKITPGESMAQYATNAERSMTLQWIEEGALNN